MTKQTLNNKKKMLPSSLIKRSKALGQKKAVLQTIGYQHTSKVPQCFLVEA